MSVIVMLRMSADPAAFEEQAAAQAEAIDRVIDVAKSHGIIAHRWYGGEDEIMVIDEWPDPESFQAFFDEAQPQIGPLLQALGVTSQPTPTFWRTLDVDDAVGWGA